MPNPSPEIRFLGDTSYGSILVTLQAAFADYAVNMSYMTETYLERRSRKNGVVLDLSPGLYVDGALVGFTLVGFGPWQGKTGAFDSATGLIKAYRGQGHAAAMFDFALPALRKRGVEIFVLDVLQQNQPAIRAYQKAGFGIQRELACLDQTLEHEVTLVPPPGSVSLIREDAQVLPLFEREAAWPLAWECSFDAQRRVEGDMVYLVARHQGTPIGLASFYPALGWLMSVQVLAPWRRRGVASALVTRLLREHTQPGQRIRADNIQSDDHATRAFLERLGFKHVASQFEMAFPLVE